MKKERPANASQKIFQEKRWHLGITAAAFLLRLLALARHELWLDEANSVIIARSDLAVLLERIIFDANPPLYYYLLHFWMQLFGQGEFALRLLSVIFGAALPPLVFSVVKKYFGARAGIYGALVAAVTPIAVYYAQNVRMYTLLPLFSLAAVYCLIEALEGRGRKYWTGYVLFSVGAVYTHNYGIFLLPVGIVWMLFIPEYRSRAGEFALSLAAVLVLYAPWLPVLLRQSEPERTNWIIEFMRPIAPLLYIPKTLQVFSAGAGYPYYFEYLGFGKNGLIAAGAIAFFAALLYFSIRSKDLPVAPDILRRRKIQFGVYLLVPLLCALIVSLAKPVYLIGRYDNVVFPAWCVLIALGIAGASQRFNEKAVIGLLLFLAAYSLLPYYSARSRGNSRAVAGHIGANSKDNDVVIFTGFRRAALEYYLGRLRSPAQLRLFSFPSHVGAHLGIYDAGTYLARPEELGKDAQTVVHEAETGLPPEGRIWLLDDPVARGVNDALFRQLQGFSVIKQLSSRSSGVYCLERKGERP